MIKLLKLISVFSALPEEDTREFELVTTDLAGEYCEKGDQKILKKLIGHKTESISYAAFYTLCVVYRRNKSFAQLSALLDRYHSRFASHASYEHLRLLYLIESDSIYDYDEILDKSYASSMRLGTNAGYVHAFADVFATICEKCEARERQDYIDRWYDKALTAVNRAVELDGRYAKYYCTKARILTLRHNYYEAVKLVRHAISAEDSNRKDYALRVSTYQYYNMYILLQQNVHNLEEKLAESGSVQSSAPCAVPASASIPAACAGEDIDFYTAGKPFAFISYSHSDSELVRSIMGSLSDRGFNLWYDRYLDAGREFWDVLAERIASSSCVLLFLSSSSVDSGFVRREISFALDEKKPIISVHLDTVSLSPGMRIQLNITQHVFMENGQPDERLIRTISSALSDRGL